MKTTATNSPQDNQSRQVSQGNTKSDRAFHSVKNDKKEHGVSNSGGQRSDQTTNEKAIQREKREAN